MRLPTIRCLETFVTAARYESFNRAAKELITTQSSVSRHVADLEARLGTQLFTRKNQRVQLSEKGRYFLRAVNSGLGDIRTAMGVISNWSREEALTIACSHAVSHLVLMPIFERSQSKMEGHASLRVLAFENDIFDVGVADRVDLVVTYDTALIGASDQTTLLPEVTTPVCSSEFAAANAQTLKKPLTQWSRKFPF